MPRIPGVSDSEADPRSLEMLEATQAKLGMVPNLFRSLAQSPVALEAYLSLGEIVGRGELGAEVREKIALTSAGTNGCRYCASAHTAVGKSLSIDVDELALNLSGQSADPKTTAMLRLVQAILASRGGVDEIEIANARSAGISDVEMTELFANVALQVFTNYFNRFAQTEIDFPIVEIDGLASPEMAVAV